MIISKNHAKLVGKTKQIKRVTWIGLVTNLLLAAGKVGAGIIGTSQALVADGIHSFSDSFTDMAIIIGVPYWTAPPDSCHPYGHHKVETLITMLIGVVLIGAGLGIGFHAITTIQEHTQSPGTIAFVVAIISIIVKEGLYRWNIHIGNKIGSMVLIANAWHHRSDGLSSIPVAIAVGTARFFPEWGFLDHIAAILVTIFILQAAYRIILPSIKELAEFGASEETVKKISDICLSIHGVKEIHKCRTRHAGNRLLVDVHVQVDPNLTIREGHDIAGNVKYKLIEQGPNIIDALIHIEPYEEIDE